MRNRSTFVLFVLLLSGLGVLWWADSAKVKSRRELEDQLDRVLPELVDVRVQDVRRVEVTPGPGAEPGRKAIVVERRGDGSWQLLKPVDAAADATLVETLVRNLKDLRKSPEAGTITGDAAPYGLDKPLATLSLYAEADHPAAPLAALDVGRPHGPRLYVRPKGGGGIEVVDGVMLEPLTVPAARWRDTALVRVPSFRVESVDVRETEPARDITLQRDERRWRLVKPIRVPADDDKAEGLVAELSALRVADGAEGFVADDVPAEGLAKYGLDKPALTVTVTAFALNGVGLAPQAIRLGAPVPGKEGQVYAVRGDQNDVVRVDAQRLREAIPGVNALRSQKVLDLNAGRVNRLKIDARGRSFDLARAAKGWELLSPVRERADTPAVVGLLRRLSELKASEYLDPKTVPDPRLDPPTIRVRGWQIEAGKSADGDSIAATTAPDGEPRFDLSFGRHDALRKTVYARVAGDSTVLAVPDAVLADLPSNAFAFRDRTVVSFSPQNVSRLTVERGHSRVTLEAPEKGGPVNLWRIVSPVQARADTAAVTSLLVALGNLRAENWETEQASDLKACGLDDPRVLVRWTLRMNPSAASGPNSSAADAVEREGELRVGNPLPRSSSLYAKLGGDPRVFSLTPGTLQSLDQELHDKSVLSFRPEGVERVVFRWPGRTVTLNKYPRPGSTRPEWQPALGYDDSGLDLNRATAFIAALSSLKTNRFLQYDGPLPVALALDEPRLVVQLKLVGESTVRALGIGGSLGPDAYAATTATGETGPVFLFSAVDPWKSLLRPPPQPDDLPDDPFVPQPSTAPR